MLYATKKNVQWSVPGANQGMSRGGSSWIELWKELSGECPLQLNDNLVLETVGVTNQCITPYFQVTDETGDTLNHELYKKLLSFNQILKKKSSTPSYVAVQCVVYNARHERIANS